MSQSDNQLELFSDPQEDSKTAANRAQKKSFIARIWGYEKTVLIIILILVTGIVSFSLGVEKSRHVSVSQPVAIVNETKTVGSPKKVEVLVPPVEVATISPEQGGQYTIQLASFKGSSYAKQEAGNLNKKGFKAFTLKKGKYVILCVGNFPNKEKAQPLLMELSKYYKSCYIRRL